jgi:hypothetical protein
MNVQRIEVLPDNALRPAPTQILHQPSHTAFLREHEVVETPFYPSSDRSALTAARNKVFRHYRRINTEGRRLTVRMTAPAEDPAQYFADSVDEIFEFSLRELVPSDMVGISIHNANHQQD